jgi:hypothetical protein
MANPFLNRSLYSQEPLNPKNPKIDLGVLDIVHEVYEQVSSRLYILFSLETWDTLVDTEKHRFLQRFEWQNSILKNR